MSVFCRTERGQLAAYEAHSDLPHKMLAILKLIDGHTRAETYQQKLSAFGDVRAILNALQIAGLIVPVAENPSSAGGQPSVRPTPAQPAAANAENEWAETCDGYAPTMQQPQSASQRVDPETIALPRSADLRHKLQSEGALQTAKQMMAQFALTHLPSQATEISEQLNQINDLEMLAVMLGGYENMVSHIGQSATEHLFAVKRILYQNL